MTCSDCIHYEICAIQHSLSVNGCRVAKVQDCKHAKDKAQFVEMPRKIGDKLYLSTRARDRIMYLLNYLASTSESFVVATEEQIEQAQKEYEEWQKH